MAHDGRDQDKCQKSLPTMFDRYVGIDYSGAKTIDARNPALQVYACGSGGVPERVLSPSATNKKHRNWTRCEIADWLTEQLQRNISLVVGIDHAFSFPISYFQRYDLNSWSDFLSDFSKHWPTDQRQVSVDSIRARIDDSKSRRSGSTDELRVTERWSSSAKSVFQFDIQGSVAKSTHAGIPWLRRIKNEIGERVHFWPFAGWEVPTGTSVLAEVYPSIFRNRFPRQDRSCDQQDAYSVARWLSESDSHGSLAYYLNPPLTDQDRRIANLEGWILGIA